MSKVFVVAGTCGQYSDTRIWYVKAFADEAKASALQGELNAWCVECGLDPENALKHAPELSAKENYESSNFAKWYDKRVGPDGYCHDELLERPPQDPQFDCATAGTQYEILEIDADLIPSIPREI